MRRRDASLLSRSSTSAALGSGATFFAGAAFLIAWHFHQVKGEQIYRGPVFKKKKKKNTVCSSVEMDILAMIVGEEMIVYRAWLFSAFLLLAPIRPLGAEDSCSITNASKSAFRIKIQHAGSVEWTGVFTWEATSTPISSRTCIEGRGIYHISWNS